MSEWKPIASAPKDGQAVLLACKRSGVQTGCYDAEFYAGWFGQYGQLFPTHWQPLPAPPDPA